MRILIALAALTAAPAFADGYSAGLADPQVVPGGAAVHVRGPSCPPGVTAVYTGHTLYCHAPASGPLAHLYQPSGPHHHAGHVVMVSPYGQGLHGHGHGVSK